MARMLVIDDEKQVRRVFRRMLERAGHTARDAGNGEGRANSQASRIAIFLRERPRMHAQPFLLTIFV